jgi:hypothetical protein
VIVTSTLAPEVEDDTPRRRITPGGVLAAVVALAIVGFWVYAFSPLAPDAKVDALEDTSYVELASARCRAAVAGLDALPPAQESDNPEERGAVVAQSNVIVADLIAGLRADAAGATGRDRELLDLWLADWDAYLDSRVQYADALLGGEAAVFTVPARSGGQITETMDGFSRTNEMADCLVPLDV